MANVNDLSRVLDNVFLGGIIDECVIKVEDDKAIIQAMDLTDSVYVQTEADLDFEDCKLGLADLTRFTKYLSSIKDVDVTLTLKDVRLTLKPKGGGRVSYLLSEADLIPSYDYEWEEEGAGDLVKDELTNFDKPMLLKEDTINEFLSLMRLFGTNSVHLKVDSKGTVYIHAGPETGHQFDVKIGKIKNVDSCEIKMYGDNIVAVLSVLDYTENPKMYISAEEDSPIVITTTSTGWVLRPMEQMDQNE